MGSFSKVSLIFEGKNLGSINKNLVKERHWQYYGPEATQTYFPELNWTSGSGFTLWIKKLKTEKNNQQHKFALEIDFAQLLSEFAGIPYLYKRSVVGGGGLSAHWNILFIKRPEASYLSKKAITSIVFGFSFLFVCFVFFYILFVCFSGLSNHILFPDYTYVLN